jgi:hypothetical protein
LFGILIVFTFCTHSFSLFVFHLSCCQKRAKSAVFDCGLKVTFNEQPWVLGIPKTCEPNSVSGIFSRKR